MLERVRGVQESHKIEGLKFGPLREDMALKGSRSWKSSQGRRRRGPNQHITAQNRSLRVGNMLIPVNAATALIAANIVVYTFTKGIFGIGANRYRLNALMKNNAMIARGQFYRLFTSIFCHGSPTHIAVNSYTLYNLGPSAERILGRGRFVFIYLASGVLANYLTFLANSSPYALGASGCTFGIIGAFGMHFYRNRKILGQQAEMGMQSIKQTVLINLFYGMSSPGIDNGAHIGGLLAGAGLSYLIGPRLVRLRQEFGAPKLVDRPILPYRKLMRAMNEYLNGASTGKTDRGSFQPMFRP